MRTVDALRTAKLILENYGWGRGDWREGDGSFCIEGAINKALWGNPGSGMCEAKQTQAVYEAVARVAGIRRTREGTYRLWLWNDKRGRTRETVIRVLDQAIGREELREARARAVVPDLVPV